MRPVGPSAHARRGAPAHSCDAACGEEHANPGGPASGAALGYPGAVVVNGAGLVFADQDTSRIRQVTG